MDRSLAGKAILAKPFYSDAEKLAEIGREIALRRVVYPKQIEAGKMTAESARRGLEIMEAIKRDYQEKVGQADLPF